MDKFDISDEWKKQLEKIEEGPKTPRPPKKEVKISNKQQKAIRNGF
jgi:hypothetical protein